MWCGNFELHFKVPEVQFKRNDDNAEPRTKVVFISGDESSRYESLEAGAMVFMKKPTSIKDITGTINILINLK